MTKQIKVIGLTGSLRENSYNKAALRAAAELLPESATLEIVDLSLIPFFNEDLEAQGIPQVVKDFKEKLAEADALLIATPEYNYSIPPALKNALDWASRGEKLPLKDKPLAIMCASQGSLGGGYVMYHLRQVCSKLQLKTINGKVLITSAQNKFDQNGKLTDDFTKKAIAKHLQSLLNRIYECKQYKKVEGF